MRRSPALGLALLLAVALAALALRLLAGSSGVGWPAPDIAPFRWNAALAAASVGAALAVSGLFLQVLLRNPLASPFVLGLSSGAGLGYMVAVFLGWRFGLDVASLVGVAGPVVAATIGGLLTLSIVWRVGQRRGLTDPLSLVLGGVVVSAIAGAAVTALQSLVPNGLRGDFIGWMMGRIPEAPPSELLATVALLALAGTLLGAWLGPALDAATLSDDEARSVGVRLTALRRTLFIAAGVLAASTVALAGPIAFIGLVAPHAARLVVGARHRPLAAGAALAGIAMLVLADAVRQVIDLGGGRLPVGVLTAIIGGPVFLVLLRRAPEGAAVA